MSDRVDRLLTELSVKIDNLIERQDKLEKFIYKLDEDKQDIDKKIVSLSEKIDNLMRCVSGCTAPKEIEDLKQEVSNLKGSFRSFRYIWGIVTAIIMSLLAWLARIKFGR